MSYNSSINEDVTRTKINRVVVPGKKRKVFRVRTNNKLKGAYAETDLEKGTITINRRKHKTDPLHKKRYPEMADTKIHEFMHAEHPKMHEKTVRKLTRKKLKRMSKKQKGRIYSKNTVVVNNNYEHK